MLHLTDSLVLVDQAKDVFKVLATFPPSVNKGRDLDKGYTLLVLSTHLLHELRGVVEEVAVEVGVDDESSQ